MNLLRFRNTQASLRLQHDGCLAKHAPSSRVTWKALNCVLWGPRVAASTSGLWWFWLAGSTPNGNTSASTRSCTVGGAWMCWPCRCRLSTLCGLAPVSPTPGSCSRFCRWEWEKKMHLCCTGVFLATPVFGWCFPCSPVLYWCFSCYTWVALVFLLLYWCFSCYTCVVLVFLLLYLCGSGVSLVALMFCYTCVVLVFLWLYLCCTGVSLVISVLYWCFSCYTCVVLVFLSCHTRVLRTFSVFRRGSLLHQRMHSWFDLCLVLWHMYKWIIWDQGMCL